jgi:glycosyltransferase involved in cell wall biosynthesis
MKLSVALCTYNGEKFIREQLESILKQTVPVNEIIICDDGSIDKTIQIIEEVQLCFSNKISLFKNERNIGSNKNFEKVITLCSGEYIFLSDQDDIWKNNKVEKIMEYFAENQYLEAIFSDADLVDNEGKNFTQKTLWDTIFFMENELKKPINLFSLISSKRNMVTGATLCFKKEIKNLILPIPDIKKYYHDEWIAIITASRNKLSYLPQNLISYRIHSEQQIGGKKKISRNTTLKHLKFSNYVLGNTTPKSYQDFKQLSKIYYRNYLKYKKVADNMSNNTHLNFKTIATTNLKLFIKNNDSLKKANPILYAFTTLIDRIRGKRQLY